MSYPMIEDPTLLAEGATSNQFAGMSLDVKQAKAAIVAKNIKNLVIDALQINWPGDSIPSEWKYPERIENGSNRVHKPSYSNPKETEFNVFWGDMLTGGYIDAPLSNSSSASLNKYVVKNSTIKIIQ